MSHNIQEIIKITEQQGKQTINARALWQYLEIKEQFGNWISRYIIFDNDYGFAENTDFLRLTLKTFGRPSVEYHLTIDMAKELAMLARSQKGKEARLWFIECEKKLRQVFTVPVNLKEALKLAYEQQVELEETKTLLIEAQPKIEFYDSVTDSKDCIEIGEAAKVLNLDFGRNTLFEKLRDLQVLMKDNVPFQRYIDCEYFRVIESKYTLPSGDVKINLKTMVTQKGLDYIRKIINKNNACITD